MRKLSLSCVFVLFAGLLVAQQKYVAKFKDGTEISFDVMEAHTDDMHKFNLLIGSSLTDMGTSATLTNIKGSFFIPDKLFVQGGATVSLLGSGSMFGADMLYFLTSKEKEIEMSITLKSTYVGANTIEKKIAKFPGTRKTYFGLHGGIYQKSYPGMGFTLTKNTGRFDIEKLSATEIQLGVGLFRGKRMRWSVDGVGKKGKSAMRQGTTQLGIFADMQLYATRNVTFTETTVDSIGNPKVSGETIEKSDMMKSAAFRLLISGKSSFVGTLDWGITYELGVGTSPLVFDTSGGIGVAPVFGLGLYFGFVD